ncbi:MAG: hypothetical protein MRZ79_19850 [Bacteroidia bacterium]|nr:hypothetical protein [Bacteroidia bacterium]
MKYFLLSVLFFTVGVAQAQNDSSRPEWPKSSVNLHVGSNVVLLPLISASFESYSHKKEGRRHHGFGIGAFGAGNPLGSIGPVWGGQIYHNFWTGAGNHHFETRLGLTVSNIPDAPIVPLIQLGYRFQKPQGANYWIIDLGTGGLGFGFGRGL